MSNTNLLNLPEIAQSQSNKFITHNEALRVLEVFAGGRVLSRSVSDAQTLSPSESDAWIVTRGAFAIVGVDTSNEIFRISGDETARFSVGDTFEVSGSTGNDGTYTVSALNYDSGNDETDITVQEDVTDSTADGDIRHAGGAFNGKNNQVGIWVGGAFLFVSAFEGAGPLWVNDEDQRVDYNGTAWSATSGSGASVVLDLGDDDSNESSALSEIATQNDTNGIASEPSADKLLLNFGLRWAGGSNIETLDSGTTALAKTDGVDFGLNLSVTDNGDGTVTVDASGAGGTDAEDDGAVVVSGATAINFSTNLSVADDGDGTVTVTASGSGGSAVVLDLSDDGTNESSDLQEIATVNDTNSIATMPAADKLLLDFGLIWPGGSSIGVEDSAASILAKATGINFGTNLSVTDDGDGTVTVDASAGGGVDIESTGSVVVSGSTAVNFESGFSVADDGDGTVTVSLASASSGDAYEDAVLALSPVAYWRLDETSGTTANDKTGNHPGTYQGGFTLDQAPLAPSGRAVDFAQEGEVSVPDASGIEFSGNFSIAFWINTTTSGAAGFIEKDGNSAYSIQQTGGDALKMNVGGSSAAIVAANPVNDGNDHFVVFVYTGGDGNGKVYVDNVDDTSSDSSGSPSYGSGNLFLYSAGGRFTGITALGDEVAMFPVALSAADVDSMFNACPVENIGNTGVQIDCNDNLFGHGQKIDFRTADFTLAAADAGKNLDVATGAAATVTVPSNANVALPVGFSVEIIQADANAVTITGQTGVTIQSKGGLTSTNGQWSAATLYKRATDEWVLVGDLA